MAVPESEGETRAKAGQAQARAAAPPLGELSAKPTEGAAAAPSTTLCVVPLPRWGRIRLCRPSLRAMLPQKTGETAMRKWGLFAVGVLLILAGSWLAGAVQTSGGVTVTDVRFPGTGGVTMSGLLYTPKTATAATA